MFRARAWSWRFLRRRAVAAGAELGSSGGVRASRENTHHHPCRSWAATCRGDRRSLPCSPKRSVTHRTTAYFRTFRDASISHRGIASARSRDAQRQPSGLPGSHRKMTRLLTIRCREPLHRTLVPVHAVHGPDHQARVVGQTTMTSKRLWHHVAVSFVAAVPVGELIL